MSRGAGRDERRAKDGAGGEAGARQVHGRDGKGPKIGIISNAGGGPVENAIGSLMGVVLKR